MDNLSVLAASIGPNTRLRSLVLLDFFVLARRLLAISVTRKKLN